VDWVDEEDGESMRSSDKKESVGPSRTSRRKFLASTASISAGLILARKGFGQEAGAAPAEAAATEAAPATAEASAATAATTVPAAATAPAAAPRVRRQLSPTSDLNIALIGLGAEGMVLMDAMLRIPGIRFKAVCDIWDYSLKRGKGMLKAYKHDVNAYEDYQDLLANEPDLDAVVIATPDFMHAEHAIACMKAGLDVYCEKEMSNNLALAREMVLTSRETGRLLQIGHQRRSNPRYHHAINRMILENRLVGRVTQANAQWNRAKSDDLGWAKKLEIPAAKLAKYGYDSMQHFRNWRWYKKYGGGPIVDLGSHQIDIFSWVFGVMPKSVIAGGGIDFYPHHEWYDNVMAIYEYENEAGISRAYYQVLTTTSYGGFHELFMGEDGALKISEVPQQGNEFYREALAPDWMPYADSGLLLPPPEDEPVATKTKDVVLDVRVSPKPLAWEIPVELTKLAHQPHLENFFDAIRVGTPLNCPAEMGYETAVAVLRVNEAVEARTMLEFAPEEFVV